MALLNYLIDFKPVVDRIETAEKNIMATLQEIADKANTAFAETNESLEAIKAKLATIGSLTPEQQAIVDSVNQNLDAVITSNNEIQEALNPTAPGE